MTKEEATEKMESSGFHAEIDRHGFEVVFVNLLESRDHWFDKALEQTTESRDLKKELLRKGPREKPMKVATIDYVIFYLGGFILLLTLLFLLLLLGSVIVSVVLLLLDGPYAFFKG